MSAASEEEQRHRAESQGQRDKGDGKRIKKLRKEVKRAFHIFINVIYYNEIYRLGKGVL
jgi:hypothetical protein